MFHDDPWKWGPVYKVKYLEFEFLKDYHTLEYNGIPSFKIVNFVENKYGSAGIRLETI